MRCRFKWWSFLILDSWRLSTKISAFGYWISRHGESPWQERTVFWWEQDISNLASQGKLGVALRENQPISAFFDGSQCLWYAVAVAHNDDFVHLWLLMFVPPRSENKLQLISVSFPKNCCLAEFQSEIILWIVGFQLLEDFFVLNQWKVFLLGHGVFVFFGDNVWRAVSNDEASKTRLLKIFHQDYWIWLLNLSPRRKSLTRTVFWWEQVISNLASQEKLGVALRQN